MLTLLQDTALSGLEMAINQALIYDPGSQTALSELQGSAIGIHSSMPPLSIIVELSETKVRLHQSWENPCDVTVEGTLVSMANLVINNSGAKTFSGSGVNISGNVDTLNRLNNIAMTLDIDWEAALGTVIGDVPAHLIAEGVRRSARHGKEFALRASTGLAEVAQEEFRLTPSKNEFTTLVVDVRTLSADADRLTARLKKLEAQVRTWIEEQSPQ
jgi:ubiquinone biosynthesis protein UbiJ